MTMFRITHQNDVNYVFLVFLLLTLNVFYTVFYCFYIDFEQVNVSWVMDLLIASFKLEFL